MHWDPSPGGPSYRRLVGGAVSTAEIAPLTGLPCDGSAGAAAQWTFRPVNSSDATVGAFESRGVPGWCLKAGPAWFGTCNNAQQVGGTIARGKQRTASAHSLARAGVAVPLRGEELLRRCVLEPVVCP